jgi:4'-phosphopantetheinyl transferase
MLRVKDSQEVLSLQDREAHVWRIRLKRDDGELTGLIQTLSDDERLRAARYRLAQVRRQFIQARAALRAILSGYTDMRPSELRFHYGAHGKPFLANRPDVSFSLSHSDGLAIVAVARGRECGADVERIRPDVDFRKIASVAFSPYEQNTLESQPPHEMGRAFFRCWTRKEAYLKALGAGFSIPPGRFSVSLGPGGGAAVLEDRGDSLAGHRWTMFDIDAGPNYAAAVAVEGKGLRIGIREENQIGSLDQAEWTPIAARQSNQAGEQPQQH